jgi:hypothetical protein
LNSPLSQAGPGGLVALLPKFHKERCVVKLADVKIQRGTRKVRFPTRMAFVVISLLSTSSLSASIINVKISCFLLLCFFCLSESEALSVYNQLGLR